MKLKATVVATNVNPAIWYACGVAEVVYASHGMLLVVTSLMDSHEARPLSLHLKGLAVDLRTRDIPQTVMSLIVKELVSFLGNLGYDIVLEADHLHIEFDPKTENQTWKSFTV